MNWVIVEDSLTDRAGHWFEYLLGFQNELKGLGDEVLFFVPKNASSEVLQKFASKAVLPGSIYRKLSDSAPTWRRYARVPWHGLKTYQAVSLSLQNDNGIKFYFVPTATVHHLVGWYSLAKLRLKCQTVKVLLFFPGLPITQDENGESLAKSHTAKLMRLILRGLSKEVKAGKVILGVETEAMRYSGEKVFGLPFRYFPHPVQPVNRNFVFDKVTEDKKDILIGCYGPGRYEKGSDVLVAAIELYLNRFPNTRARFVLQWVNDFRLPDGKMACLPQAIKYHPRVEIIRRLFREGEYGQWLARTDALALPYRRSSYGLRASRVVIEALVNGLPVVVTRGTTLAQQAKKFGAAVECEDGDVEILVSALRQLEEKVSALKMQSMEKAPLAIKHFSVEHFRELLVDAGA